MAEKKKDHIIIAIHVTDRVKQASKVQETFTKCGDCIKTRLGLHHTEGKSAKPNGLILIEFVGSRAKEKVFVSTLNKIAGVEAQSIVFEH
jgi:hypothetical protein